MTHVSIGDQEQQALLVGQSYQVFGLLNGQAQGLITGNVDAGFQESLTCSIVADIGSNNDDEVDAVFASSFSLCHLFEACVATIGSDTQLSAGLPALFQSSGEAACNQSCHGVDIDGLSVCVTDEGTGAAAHHAVVQFFHALFSPFSYFLV